MKILTNKNRKEILIENINTMELFITNRIKDQKEILKDQNKTIKKYLEKTEVNEDNELEFLKDISEFMETREKMIKKIESWISSLTLIKDLKDLKQKGKDNE